MIISIHVPSWGTTIQHSYFLSASVNFNPRSLVGNDRQTNFCHACRRNISIHVPSWGTTTFQAYSQVSYIISIHVPSWGTTISSNAVTLMISISIHVPSWGTTVLTCETVRRTAGFQSTFPRGERLFKRP